MFALMTSALSQIPIAAKAQTPSPNVAAKPATPLMTRITQLPDVLSGKMPASDFFAPSFLAAVPEVQLKALSDQFIAQYGQPIGVTSITPYGPTSATVKIEYEKAIATADISVEAAAPHKIVGLLIKGFEMKGDSITNIDAEFASLPGAAGYLVEKVGANGSRSQIAGRNVTQQFAIASTFKLYVLAELAAQVDAGRRKWTDVVPLTNISYSSSATQGWPRDTPVTLQTLATWMISVSDNAATDALIRVLGREAIEKKLALVGHSNPDKALPLLTTVEAFALKTNPELRKNFETASESKQRALLGEKAAELTYEKVNLVALGSGPAAIDSIEWFASPVDVAGLLHNMRGMGNETMLNILSVNKGVTPTSSAKWTYLGYKGGSEPGVISMSFLGKSKAGEYYTITGSWNNPAAEVNNAAFVALMGRLLDSLAS
jgi:beta-lactamase class A